MDSKVSIVLYTITNRKVVVKVVGKAMKSASGWLNKLGS